MEPLAWLNANAVDFNKLTKQEIEIIKDFSLLWSFFEFTKLNGNGNVNALTKLVNDLDSAGRLKRKPFDGPLDYFRNRYFDGKAFTPLFSGLLLTPRDQPLVEKVISGKINDDVHALQVLLIIVYRLRNNLFHGTKFNYGIGGQRDNFLNANSILMAVGDL